MQTIKEKISFWLTALIYVVFNLRIAGSVVETVKESVLQILYTAPYVAGASWLLIAFLQYMSQNQKMPWERRFRIFFTIGIIGGLFYAIYEYAGAGAGVQQ